MLMLILSLAMADQPAVITIYYDVKQDRIATIKCEGKPGDETIQCPEKITFVRIDK